MKLSVIIPVCNVAPFLGACLDSVANQDYSDWEAVCIDDGSTDGSSDILDSYARKDTRFVVEHQTNAGVSAARNKAMSLMTGDYFLFLDGDDILLQGALKSVVTCLLETGADAILTAPLFCKFADEESLNVNTSSSVSQWDRVSSRRDLIVGKYGVQGFVCGRVLSYKVFSHVRFPIGRVMAEDLYFWIDVLSLDAAWVVLKQALEGYRMHSGSVCHVARPQSFVDVMDAYCYVVERLRDEDIFGRDAVETYWDKWNSVYKSFMHRAYDKWREFSPAQRSRILRFNGDLRDSLGWYPLDCVFRLRWISGRLGVIVLVLPIAAKLDWIIMGMKSRMRRWSK